MKFPLNTYHLSNLIVSDKLLPVDTVKWDSRFVFSFNTHLKLKKKYKLVTFFYVYHLINQFIPGINWFLIHIGTNKSKKTYSHISSYLFCELPTTNAQIKSCNSSAKAPRNKSKMRWHFHGIEFGFKTDYPAVSRKDTAAVGRSTSSIQQHGTPRAREKLILRNCSRINQILN